MSIPGTTNEENSIAQHSHLCPTCKDRWECADASCQTRMEVVCGECDPIGG